MSPLWGSNPQPYAYEAYALPTELRRPLTKCLMVPVSTASNAGPTECGPSAALRGGAALRRRVRARIRRSGFRASLPSRRGRERRGRGPSRRDAHHRPCPSGNLQHAVRETRTPELLFWSQTRCRLAMPPRRAGDGPSSFRLASASSNIPPGLGSQHAARVLPLRAPLLLPSPMLPRLSRPSGWDSNRRQAIMTPVGFEPTRGNPIGSAGRRRGRPSAVSSAHYVAIGNYRRARRDARCDFPADTQI
jgi:hypothetical protein